MNRVLLTGASGYLGGHVLLRLLERGDSVRALVHSDRHKPWMESLGVECVPGDLLDYPSLRRACHGVDGLIHTAALVGQWSRIENDQFAVNVDGSSNLFRAAHRARVPHMVHVSSVVTVGCTRDGRALDESAPWEGRDQPDIHYIRTKRESEERVFAATRGHVPISVVNPGSMVGAAAQDGSVKGHVQEVLGHPGGRSLPGGSTIAHVSDVAEGVVSALTRGRHGERYLLGGHNLSWLELHTKIAEVAGVEPPSGVRSPTLGRLLEWRGWVLDQLRLSRPKTTSERYRIWGWYSYADSSKAVEELGYQIPSLEVTLGMAVGAGRASEQR